MVLHQGYRYRLRGLTGDQRRLLAQMDGQARYIWNLFLAADLGILESGGTLPTYAERAAWLPRLRKHEPTSWLALSSSASQQAELRDLDMAWQRWRKGLGRRPRFKKKGVDSGFRWSGRQHFEIDQENGRIRLPKIGWLRYRNSRPALGEVINAAVSRKNGHWYISVGTERQTEQPATRSLRRRVGVDMGIACHTATSAGKMIAGPNALKKAAKQLARAQRALARKIKGSNRRKKQIAKVARIHERVGNVRQDHLHKLTSDLAKNHGLVVIENLKVSNMSRSAKGTIENPGTNVRAKSGLNRSILDQGWGEMRRQLTYKLGWNGGTLVAVNPANTSRKCSHCSHVSKDSRTTQSHFECVTCGHRMNADTNAAHNILAAGLAVTARGGLAVGQPAKRETTERPRVAVRIPVL